MKVLVINCGSLSLKYQLLDMTDKSVLAQGLVERISIFGSQLTHRQGDLEKVILRELSNHKEAISLILESLTDSEYGVVGNLQEISAVGKEVIHGDGALHKRRQAAEMMGSWVLLRWRACS